MTDPTPQSEASGQPDDDQNSGPWYRDGLKFRCTGCGNCCTGGPGYVWVDDDEIEAIAEYLDKPIGEIRLMYCRPVRQKISLVEYANGDCVFFDAENRNCTIYPVRPIQCRTWPFWRSNLGSEADWKAVARDCPGAGTGDFFPLEEIEIRVAERDM
ncbi:MAG: YkgJ family cysteine cluster protein [Planctomycetota bacterium]